AQNALLEPAVRGIERSAAVADRGAAHAQDRARANPACARGAAQGGNQVLTRPLRICAFAAILVTAGCATIVPAPRTEVPAAVPPESWARVLDRFVDDHGRVDFEKLAHDRRDLDRYVAWVYAVGPSSDPGLFPTRGRRGRLPPERVQRARDVQRARER